MTPEYPRDEIPEEIVERMAAALSKHLRGGEVTWAEDRRTARVALLAALSYEPTRQCQTCGGRGGFYPVGDCEGPPPEWKPCPAGCSNGRVPDAEAPRLALVKRAADAYETFIAGDGEPAIRARQDLFIALNPGGDQ